MLLILYGLLTSALTFASPATQHVAAPEAGKAMGYLLNDSFLREKFQHRTFNGQQTSRQTTDKRYSVVQADDRPDKPLNFLNNDKFSSFEDLLDHRSVTKWVPITDLLFKGFSYDQNLVDRKAKSHHKKKPSENNYTPKETKYSDGESYTEESKSIVGSYTQNPVYAYKPKPDYVSYATTARYEEYRSSTPTYNKPKYITHTIVPALGSYSATPKYDTYTNVSKYDTYSTTPRYENYSKISKYDTYTTAPNYDTHPKYQNHDTHKNKYDTYDTYSTTPSYENEYRKPKGDRYPLTTKYDTYSTTPKYDTHYPSTPTYQSYHKSDTQYSSAPKYDTSSKADTHYSSTPTYQSYHKADTHYSSTPKYDTYSTMPKYDTRYSSTPTYQSYPKADNHYSSTPKYDTYSKADTQYSSTPKYDTYSKAHTYHPSTSKYDTYSTTPKYQTHYSSTPTYQSYPKTDNQYSSTPKYDTYSTTPKYDTHYYSTPKYDTYPKSDTHYSSIPKSESYSKLPKSATYPQKPKYDTDTHVHPYEVAVPNYKPKLPIHDLIVEEHKGAPSRYPSSSSELGYHDTQADVYPTRPGGYKPIYHSKEEGYQIYVPEEYSDTYAGIPGIPGKDYPIFDTPPYTTFNCGDQDYPGYYADTDSRCQVFHICQADGRANAFLCPNGTLFNQQYFVCDWWYNFNCDYAPSLYRLNIYLYDNSYRYN